MSSFNDRDGESITEDEKGGVGEWVKRLGYCSGERRKRGKLRNRKQVGTIECDVRRRTAKEK